MNRPLFRLCLRKARKRARNDDRRSMVIMGASIPEKRQKPKPKPKRRKAAASSRRVRPLYKKAIKNLMEAH